MKAIPLTNELDTVSVGVMGYNYDLTTNVFLSSSSLTFPVLTSINLYTNLRRVSAICPPFSGYQIPYTVIDKNRINITVSTDYITGSGGYIDVIFTNRAGYTKLSDKQHLIQYLSSGPIQNRIIAINDDDIITIDNSYLVYIF